MQKAENAPKLMPNLRANGVCAKINTCEIDLKIDVNENDVEGKLYI